MTSQAIANACGFLLSLSMLSTKLSRFSRSTVVKDTAAARAEAEREERSNSSLTKTDRSNNNDSEEKIIRCLAASEKEHARTFWLIRVLYISYYASTGSLVPYLSVYFRSLGHGGHVIGILSAIRPFINFLVAPLWGMAADHSGDTLGVLRFAMFFSMLGYMAIGVYNDVVSLMVAVIFTAIFYAPVRSLMDSMVLEKLAEIAEAQQAQQPQKQGDDNPQQQQQQQQPTTSGTEKFGKLRLWGPIGYGLGCSLAGMIVTNQTKSVLTDVPSTPGVLTEESLSFSKSIQIMAMHYLNAIRNSMTGYKVLFGIFAAMSVPMMATLLAFPRKTKVNNKTAEKEGSGSEKKVNGGATRITEGLSTLVHNKDALLFFFLVFVIGINYGGIETFCYVRMREVGATGQQIGMSRLICALSGTPMFWLSGHLKRWFKAEQVLVLSLMAFTARFVVYALIRSPLDALPAESIRGIAFAAFYSTASTYVHHLSPPGLNSTMLMLMNAMHGGFGQSVGSILAGKLQSQVGTSQTFLLMAYMNAAFIAFIVLYLSYFRGLTSPKIVKTVV